MTEEIAISAQNVAKKYRLFASPQERLKEALHPFRKRYHKEFWALKGVSFDVPRGQTVGVLGRNGSGKSTLLQIMAGIMQPTTGEMIVNGRVSALLELGTGFNPEFTGRENVLFQARVVGLTRDEMDRRLPEIESFAEIGEFFDQPVKTYSSGMFVRVGFAAAVHVDPDILIIDEALAVGDAKFQHKCFEHLGDLRNRGKTILFVTHSTSLVTSYSERAFLFDSGKLIATGDPGLIVDKYHELLFGNGKSPAAVAQDVEIKNVSENMGETECRLLELLSKVSTKDVCHARRSYNKNETRFGNGDARIIDYALQSEGLWDAADIMFGSRVTVYVKALFLKDIRAPATGFSVKTIEGLHVYGTNTIIMGRPIKRAAQGDVRVFKFSFRLSVGPGNYFFDLAILEVDGSRGGSAVDVRRSIAHCVVSLEKERPFDGLVDLAPSFDVLTE
jgi:lipopolysaccharide transport system ATP-binding protein